MDLYIPPTPSVTVNSKSFIANHFVCKLLINVSSLFTTLNNESLGIFNVSNYTRLHIQYSELTTKFTCKVDIKLKRK